MREDLSPGQRAVQAVHAAVEMARHGLIPEGVEHPHLVLLAVTSQRELLKAADRLDQAGILYRQFIEPDLDNAVTALCTGPLSGESRKHFRRYSLLRST